MKLVVCVCICVASHVSCKLKCLFSFHRLVGGSNQHSGQAAGSPSQMQGVSGSSSRQPDTISTPSNTWPNPVLGAACNHCTESELSQLKLLEPRASISNCVPPTGEGQGLHLKLQSPDTLLQSPGLRSRSPVTKLRSTFGSTLITAKCEIFVRVCLHRSDHGELCNAACAYKHHVWPCVMVHS